VLTFLYSPPLSCRGDVLAREPGGQDIDRLDAGPVDLPQIAEVRHVRQPGRQHLRDVRIGVGAPRDPAAAEGCQHAQVEAPVAGTYRAEGRFVVPGFG
jgi:hypothetical protein